MDAIDFNTANRIFTGAIARPQKTANKSVKIRSIRVP
jgi:hypothetical protein